MLEYDVSHFVKVTKVDLPPRRDLMPVAGCVVGCWRGHVTWLEEVTEVHLTAGGDCANCRRRFNTDDPIYTWYSTVDLGVQMGGKGRRGVEGFVAS